MTPAQSFLLAYLEKQAAPNFMSALRAGKASRAVDAAARLPTAAERALISSKNPADAYKGFNLRNKRRIDMDSDFQARNSPNPLMPGEEATTWSNAATAKAAPVVDPESPLQRFLKRI
jgi:hypothetical protein